MRLFWYDRPEGNFGDDLNPWLWPRLLPALITNDGPWLVGIGTLLNERLPAAGDLYVLGSGAGLGMPPVITERWHIIGVRGPLTAALLGLAPAAAIGDPAILAADFVEPAASRDGIGFMPHYASMAHWDWRITAEACGLQFVDPEAPVEKTLAQIAGLSALLTEAMHGAIVADALRTPWVGLRIDPGFYAWKWRDWGLSVETEPVLHALPALSDYRSSPRDWLKRGLLAAGIGSRITPPPPRQSAPATVTEAMIRLEELAARAPRQLSPDAAINAAKDRVRDAVQRLRTASPP